MKTQWLCEVKLDGVAKPQRHKATGFRQACKELEGHRRAGRRARLIEVNEDGTDKDAGEWNSTGNPKVPALLPLDALFESAAVVGK